MSHRFGSVPLAAEVDPFEAEVSGDQGLVTRRKPEYGRIVSNTLQHAISGARLPANPGDQGFFKKRQSEANIDDKTIPPKPATLGRFPQSNAASSQFIYPSPQRGTPHPIPACRQLRRPWLGSRESAQFPEVTNGNCPQGLSAVTRPW